MSRRGESAASVKLLDRQRYADCDAPPIHFNKDQQGRSVTVTVPQKAGDQPGSPDPVAPGLFDSTRRFVGSASTHALFRGTKRFAEDHCNERQG